MLHLCAAQRHDVIFPAFRLRGSTEIFFNQAIHNQAIHFRFITRRYISNISDDDDIPYIKIKRDFCHILLRPRLLTRPSKLLVSLHKAS
jgi:hypothetical protein